MKNLFFSKVLLYALFALFSQNTLIGQGQLDQPKNNTGSYFFTNLSSEDYQSKLNEYSAKGYRPIDVEIRGGNSKKYDVVFRENTDNRACEVRTSLDHNAFSKKWEELKNKGYRLIDQETYVYKNKRYYGGIWIKNKEKLAWASFRNLNSTEFSQKFKIYRDKGFMPVDVEAYKSGSKFLYSVIWVENKQKLTWALQRDIPKSDFSKKFDEWTDKGFRLYSIEAYTRNSRQEYATIWVKDSKAWLARRDMNKTGFNNKWKHYRDLGYRLEDLEVYNNSNGQYYAAVWVENSNRLRWNHREEVTSLVEEYLKKNKTAGFSVAIAHRGQIKYMRGWGQADRDLGKSANSRTVFRLASVSKAVTGVLAYRLEQKGLLDLNKKTRSYEPRLPEHHDHTVGQVLSNRGKVRHYKNNDPATSSGTKKVYTSAYEASKLFSADPLIKDKYKYSTHAYTLAAAAMEKAAGNSFSNLIKSQLSNPFNLSSLACEELSESNKNRSKIYQLKNGKFTKLDPLSLSWKYAGGGMESSAYDLVRFGIKLLDEKIISKTRLSEMTTKPDNLNNYAFGWNTNTENGHKVFAKNGGQPGARSYMRCYPDEEIVIVLLANTRGAGISQLGRDIGKIVLP